MARQHRPIPREAASWLAVRSLPGMDATLFARLLELVGDPTILVQTAPGRLESVQGISPELARSVAEGGDVAASRQVLRSLAEAGVEVLLWSTPGYPAALQEAGAQFPLLFYVGNAVAFTRRRMIGFFGAKISSDPALELGLWLGAELARRGFCVVGRLGDPVAGAAHGGALERDGWAVAVVPHGLGRPLTGRAKEHAVAVSRRGAVCTSAMPDEAAGSGRRSEALSLAAAFCDGLVVLDPAGNDQLVELARDSADRGKPVFAARSGGDDGLFHNLVQEGAVPLPPGPGFSVDLVLRELERPRRQERPGQLDLFG